MTTKRFLFALTLFTTFVTPALAQNEAGKTFTKSFNTDGKGTIRLDLPGAVDLKVWGSPSIRFEISVNIPSSNGSMLNELATLGRYNLVAKADGDALVITAPNLQKQLKVKGEMLKESLTFMVFVPKGLQIEILPNTTAMVDLKK